MPHNKALILDDGYKCISSGNNHGWEDRTITNWPKLLYKSYGISMIDWNSGEILWALQAQLLIKLLDYQASVLKLLFRLRLGKTL